MIVVGAGYAGLHAARAIGRAGVAVTVVDQDGRHDFVTRLAAVAGGTAPSRDAGVVATTFVERTITERVVTVADAEVGLADGRTLTADAVVMTVGSVPSKPPVEGIEFARALRRTSDAIDLRERLPDEETLIVIGGGATGVQLAGAAAHTHRDLEVHLIERDDHLLAALGESLSTGAERVLRGRGVHLHLGRDVDEITAHGVELDGEPLEGLVVWAGGFSPAAGDLGLPVDDEDRIVVNDQLQVLGFERTFAAGDVAAHTDSKGEPLAMSAQIAVQAGSAAGRNAAASVNGERLQRAELKQQGWVLDLGGRRGVAQLGPIPLAVPILDRIPPVLHHAIDLKTLLGVGGIAGLREAPRGMLHLFTGR